jgi:hypothetical protein
MSSDIVERPRTAHQLKLQAMARAFARVGLKCNDQRMLASAQRLLEASQQPADRTRSRQFVRYEGLE